MSALLEAPTKSKYHSRGTWSPEQAAAANAKSHVTRRINAQLRKQAKVKEATKPEPERDLDPLHTLTRSLAIAAKRNQGKLAVNLATALAKLKNAPRPEPSSNYTPTPCSSPRQPTASTPQSSQVVQPQVEPAQPNFVQYIDHSIGHGKESLNCVTVGCPRGVGTGPGPGMGGVIDPITHRPNSSLPLNPVDNAVQVLKSLTPEQLRSVLDRLGGTNAGSTQSAGGHLKGGNVDLVKDKVGVAPQEGMENLCVGGVWVWGKRRK